MKKQMRIAVFGVAVVLLPSALIAQMDSNVPPSVDPQGAMSTNGSQPTPAPMRETLGAPGLTGRQMADSEFLRTATAEGIAEVKMGQLGVEKGGVDVKTFGQQMVDDHSAINKDMGTVADSLGVMLPKKMDKDDQAEYDKLSTLSGKDFDTEYIPFIAKAHWKKLHDFYMEASTASDPELSSEVVKALRMMHEHLGMIDKVAAADGITLPPRPPRPSAKPAASAASASPAAPVTKP
jgi:putative membrane protein